MKLEKFFQTRVGDGGDGGGGGDDGRISPEHPSPILHAPRDIISRKGKSLTPMIWKVCRKPSKVLANIWNMCDIVEKALQWLRPTTYSIDYFIIFQQFQCQSKTADYGAIVA